MFTNQRGSALLSALFIMTLAAIATTTLTLQLKNRIAETHLLLDTDQFQLDSTVIRYWALDFLSHQKHQGFGQKPDKTTYTKQNISFPMLPNMRFSIEIVDLNARFNLNHLIYPSGKTTFYRLSKHLLEDESNQKSYFLTSMLTDWISDYQPGYKKNANFIAHLPMVSLSELALIPAIKPKDLNAITPYLTVLPPKTRINLNTASEELLMAMAQGGDDTLKYMEALIDARTTAKGIESLADVRDILRKLSIAEDDVTTESEYFLSVGHIKKDRKNFTLYTLLQRIKNKNGSFSVHVVHETWNID